MCCMRFTMAPLYRKGVKRQLKRMMLVFLDLSTGYLLLEEAVEDRSYVT